MAVTIKDVARKAQVGVGTVSRVINDSPAVSAATRQRVEQAIKELDYTPNLNARRLSSGKTWQIAVVLPYLTLPSYVERLRGVQQIFGESEYYPILYSVGTPSQKDEYLELLTTRNQVDGLLMISLPLSDAQTRKILNNRVPAVLIDSDNEHLSHVVVNDVQGGRLATNHLLQHGHRRIGFLSHYRHTPYQRSAEDRYQGYRQALKQAGIPFREHYVIEGGLGREAAEGMAHKLLDLAQPPTAIFATSDTQAIGVLDAARARRMTVPGELSVIGFDDIRDAEYVNLTTVNQPLYESGLQGATLLLKELTHPQQQPEQGILPLQLKNRMTTGPNPELDQVS